MVTASIKDAMGEATLVSSKFWLEDDILYYEEDDEEIVKKEGRVGKMALGFPWSIEFKGDEKSIDAMEKVFQKNVTYSVV